jgi:leucine dehydrogenase
MLTIKEISVEGYKRVIEAIDTETKLHSFIAIHNSSLGPAMGGMRIHPYSSPHDALQDALRLAKAMTYKSAFAENGLGGGKSVIIAQPHDKTDKLLSSFALAVDSLQGEYIVAEDVGSTPEDMEILNKTTPYVAALPTNKSSGDPSRFTAWGVFRGIQAVVQKLWNTSSLRKKVIAIQGLGSVGGKLADILFWEGAELILSEIDLKKLQTLSSLYGAQTVDPENYCATKCDILAPCALGGILNNENIEKMHCKAIAGAANNQLASSEQGTLLKEKGILYAPDYVINAGGIINAAAEFDADGYNPKISRDKVNHIHDNLLQVLDRAEIENKPTNQIADEIAEYKLQHGIGKRLTPIKFRHSMTTRC